MVAWIDASCILIVFFSLVLLATYRIVGMIKIFAVQSFVLGALPFLLHAEALAGRDVLIGLGTIILKVIVVPNILMWAMRHVSMRSEVKPLIGVSLSILCGALLIAGAFWIAGSLKVPGALISDLVVPCSLATVLLGFLLLVTRTRAVAQVLGYLVMENGIFLFALSLFDAMPVLIEMGILLDVCAAVFIMAIVMNHINEEFEHTPASVSRSKMGETF